MRCKLCFMAALFGLFTAGGALAGVAAKPKAASPAPVLDIEMAHNLGRLGEERLQSLVDAFNQQNRQGKIRLVRYEQGARPAALNLVRRYEMEDVLRKAGNFVPLHQVLRQAKTTVPVQEIMPDLLAGVRDEQGRLMALPVAYSTPILFYNKTAFRNAGLDPEHPPATWFEMQGMLDRLQASGYECPYTSAWPTWVHVDNVSALSGAPAVTEKGILAFNTLPQVKHVAMMATWQKAKYFVSFGRAGEANRHFQDGECAMITTDSWEHTMFSEAKGVELGVSALPHHDDVYGGRHHTLADGASLWLGGGQSPAAYQVAAGFIKWLMSPEKQIEMAKIYGQLPMTPVARMALRSRVFRDHEQTLTVAFASLKGNGAKPALRAANMDSVRRIVDEELEAVWQGEKPAKAALDDAVLRGNSVLAARPYLRKPQLF